MYSSTDCRVIDLNPFEDIYQNGETIWRLDNFEDTIPALMCASDLLNSEPTERNYHSMSNMEISHSSDTPMDQMVDNLVEIYNQSITSDDNISLEAINDYSHDNMGSGDGKESIWGLALNWENKCLKTSLKTSLKSKKREKRGKTLVNSLHPQPNLVRFPEKLWKIVNECSSGAIKWSPNGNSILINYDLFQNQYLNDFLHFKTKNLSSFVRQLNLYGFHKLGQKTKKKTNASYPLPLNGINSLQTKDQILSSTSSLSPTVNQSMASEETHYEMHEFKSEYFRKGQMQLLDKIKRKYPNVANDENSHQLIQNKVNTQRKPLKQLNAKTKSKQMTKNLTKSKESFEENLNSVNFKSVPSEQKSGVPSEQSSNCFQISYQLIIPQMFDQSIQANDENVSNFMI